MRCRHCGDPNPDVLHMFAKGPAPPLRVGSLVVAKKATDVCHPGEVGVVFEEYRLHDHAAWGTIFESGRHNGFNACKVQWFLRVTGEVCEQLERYGFENIRRLDKDFESGVFAPGFRKAHTVLA